MKLMLEILVRLADLHDLFKLWMLIRKDPHNVHMNNEEFKHYWFGYKVILLLRDEPELTFDRDWETDLLGTYYIKPNYLGHCAHICNAGFLVPISQRRNKCTAPLCCNLRSITDSA